MSAKNQPILTIVKLSALPDNTDAVLGILRALAEASSRERGCTRFEVLQPVTDPTQYLTIERWDSEADANAHMASAHVREALERLTPLIAGPPQEVRYRSVDRS